MEKKENKGIVIIVAILVIVILGLVTYILYDKTLKIDNSKWQDKQIDSIVSLVGTKGDKSNVIILYTADDILFIDTSGKLNYMYKFEHQQYRIDQLTKNINEKLINVEVSRDCDGENNIYVLGESGSLYISNNVDKLYNTEKTGLKDFSFVKVLSGEKVLGISKTEEKNDTCNTYPVKVYTESNKELFPNITCSIDKLSIKEVNLDTTSNLKCS